MDESIEALQSWTGNFSLHFGWCGTDRELTGTVEVFHEADGTYSIIAATFDELGEPCGGLTEACVPAEDVAIHGEPMDWAEDCIGEGSFGATVECHWN